MFIVNVWTLHEVEKFEFWKLTSDVGQDRSRDLDDSDQTEDLQTMAIEDHVLYTLVCQLPAPV
jgi:hypothetical protein